MEAGGSSSSEPLNIVKLPHHEEEPLCETRAKYRQGKKLTAVKVYTIADESRHLLLRNVTSVDVHDELAALCQRFGPLAQFGPVDGYETERFTRVYHVQYRRIAAARFAKSQLDDRNFFGTHLKACYAPELETLEETADKLRWRRLYYRNGLARLRGGQRHKPGSGRGASAPAVPETTDRDPSSDLTSPEGEPSLPLIGPCVPLPGEWAPPPANGIGQDGPQLPPLPPPPVAADRPRKRIVFKRKRAEEPPVTAVTGAASADAAPTGPFAQAELARTADRLKMVREQIQQAVLQSHEKRRRVDAQDSDPA